MISGVYAIQHIPSGRRYIGSSNDVPRRKREHFAFLRRGAHKNSYLQAAWNKYGESAFEFLVIEQVDDRALLAAREEWHLRNTDRSTLMNLQLSAWTTPPVTQDFRERIRALHIGKPKSAAHVAKMRAARLGVPRFDLRGQKRTPETRAKQSAAAMGHGCSEATREKLSAASKRIGRRWSNAAHAANSTPEAREARSAAAKAGWATIRKAQESHAL